MNFLSQQERCMDESARYEIEAAITDQRLIELSEGYHKKGFRDLLHEKTPVVPYLIPHYIPAKGLHSNSYADKSYVNRLERSRRDFTRNIPCKTLEEFPNSGNEGLYGYTYLGGGKVWRNERLRGTDKGYETDVHECIHTEWEYETRLLARWMTQEDEDHRKN